MCCAGTERSEPDYIKGNIECNETIFWNPQAEGLINTCSGKDTKRKEKE